MLGVQFFAVGLLGELIIFTHARQIKDYRVERVVALSETDAIKRKESTPAEDGRAESTTLEMFSDVPQGEGAQDPG